MTRESTLVLIRHAEIDCATDGAALLCGSYDAPLNPNGQAQVVRLRARLLCEPASAAYSSPLQRALATACAVPEPLQGNVRLLRSLAEIDCGSVEGLRIDEIRTIYPDLWQQNEAQNDDEFCWPEGETYRRFRRRVLRAIRCIARKHAGERILLFTHAGVITQILGSLTGQCSAVWATPRVRNASLTEIAWSETGGRVICCDDTSHLQTAVTEPRL